jgi:adenylate kinase family enzyme
MKIIHISGAPGSGKSTMGIKLKNKFKSKIVVKDLDELFSEFMLENKFNAKKYQKYIDNFIENQNKKIIVFVGLNKEHLTETLYNIYADYKYYIDLPININLERHFNREINGWLNWMVNRNKNILFNQLIKNQKDNENDLIKSFSRVLDIAHQKKFIESFSKIYKTEKYIFVDYDSLYKIVCNIINKL